MKGDIRRDGILIRLMQSDLPVSASSLASEFGVSRQIIVKDISKLRETGNNILSLARGYVIEKKKQCRRVFKVIHGDEETEKELNLIVDLGGAVEDVFIYHKAYDVVTARLDIHSRNDIKNFMHSITSGKSSLLKNVTFGYHYHTVSADNEEILNTIQGKLKDEGFLAPLQEYEPEEINCRKDS